MSRLCVDKQLNSYIFAFLTESLLEQLKKVDSVIRGVSQMYIHT